MSNRAVANVDSQMERACRVVVKVKQAITLFKKSAICLEVLKEVATQMRYHQGQYKQMEEDHG